MKIFYITLLALASFEAAFQKADAVEITPITNGVFLLFAADRPNCFIVTNEPIQYDDRIVWDIYCPTGVARLFLPFPDGIRIAMYDTNHVEVPKTLLGEDYGKRFSHTLRRSDYGGKGIAIFTIPTNSIKTIGWYAGRIFYRPLDLFQITKPGIYTMEIQMEMFYQGPKTKDPYYPEDFFRFAPVKIKVEKLPDEWQPSVPQPASRTNSVAK